MSDVRIVIAPSVNLQGKRIAGRFDARLEGVNTIVSASTQPFFDAARALLDLGFSESDLLTMVHAHAPTVVALKAQVGVAAMLDVMGTRFVRRKSRPKPYGGRTDERDASPKLKPSNRS